MGSSRAGQIPTTGLVTLLDEPTRSNHVDEVGQKGAVTSEELNTPIIPSMTGREL